MSAFENISKVFFSNIAYSFWLISNDLNCAKTLRVKSLAHLDM